MKNNTNCKVLATLIIFFSAIVLHGTSLAKEICPVPKNTGFANLKGPWELMAKMGMEGADMRFPITVRDENKPQTINKTFPIMGTPIEIKVKQYMPDLKWETSTVEQKGAGSVAKLSLKGKNLEQELWLSTDDPAKQAVSSEIGGIRIERLYNKNVLDKLMSESRNSRSTGILSVWIQDANIPLEFLVKTADTITIPGSKYKVTVTDYVPHYTLDTDTKKITSQSDKPVNPAIKIKLDDGEHVYEQWLWSKFKSFHHTEN
jgi:hypothetical protein